MRESEPAAFTGTSRTQPPSVRLTSGPSWTSAEEGRHRRRAPLAVGLGVILVLLMAVPVAVLHQRNWLGHMRVESQWLWRWSPPLHESTSRIWSRDDTPLVGWVLAALPAVAGALAIAGGCMRGLGKSVLLLLAGMALLFFEPMLRGFTQGGYYYYRSGSGMMALESSMSAPFFWPALFAVLFMGLAVGGHRAAARGRGRPSTRLAAFLPSLLGGVPLTIGLLLAINASASALSSGFYMPSGAGGALLAAVIALTAVTVLGLLFSALLGLVNAAIGEARVAAAGFWCGAVGLISLAALFCLAAFAYVGFRVGYTDDAMGCWGVVQHSLLPALAGLLLLPVGYLGLWTWVDREWARARDGAHLGPSAWPAETGDGV